MEGPSISGAGDIRLNVDRLGRALRLLARIPFVATTLSAFFGSRELECSCPPHRRLKLRFGFQQSHGPHARRRNGWNVGFVVVMKHRCTPLIVVDVQLPISDRCQSRKKYPSGANEVLDRAPAGSKVPGCKDMIRLMLGGEQAPLLSPQLSDLDPRAWCPEFAFHDSGDYPVHDSGDYPVHTLITDKFLRHRSNRQHRIQARSRESSGNFVVAEERSVAVRQESHPRNGGRRRRGVWSPYSGVDPRPDGAEGKRAK